jgi:hypothetical protein
MDNGMRYFARIWREAKDDYYRIETNYPKLIRKLQKRKETVFFGDNWQAGRKLSVLCQIQYKKPSRALEGFLRITGRDSAKRDAEGDYYVDLGLILDKKTEK